MMIFIDGADGSGKSTLVQQLSERYVVIRMPRMTNQFLAWSRFTAINDGLQILFDRSPLTEIVYRSVDKCNPEFSLEDCLHWLRRGKLVLCDTDTSYDDAQRRGEDNITDEAQHVLIRDRYHCLADILTQNGVDVYHYDWHFQNVDEVINFIEGGNEDESATV